MDRTQTRADYLVSKLFSSPVALRYCAQVDGQGVMVDYQTGKVDCEDAALAARVDKAVGRVLQAMRPCPLVAVD